MRMLTFPTRSCPVYMQHTSPPKEQKDKHLRKKRKHLVKKLRQVREKVRHLEILGVFSGKEIWRGLHKETCNGEHRKIIQPYRNRS